MVCNALEADGHIIKTVDPPSPYNGLVIASQLLTSDGCQTIASFLRSGEQQDAGAAQLCFYMRLPRLFKYFQYLWVKYVRRDSLWAGLLRHFHQKSSTDLWRLVAQREAYKASWHEWWESFGRGEVAEQGRKPDVILTVPNAMPALPHGAMRDAVSSCGYTFLFNMVCCYNLCQVSPPHVHQYFLCLTFLQLDYPSGVLPVTHVDQDLDKLPQEFDFKNLNGIEMGAYMHYDASKMSGLPIGIQVIGQRFQEEKVLATMEKIEDCLHKRKQGFTPLDIK